MRRCYNGSAVAAFGAALSMLDFSPNVCKKIQHHRVILYTTNTHYTFRSLAEKHRLSRTEKLFAKRGEAIKSPAWERAQTFLLNGRIFCFSSSFFFSLVVCAFCVAPDDMAGCDRGAKNHWNYPTPPTSHLQSSSWRCSLLLSRPMCVSMRADVRASVDLLQYFCQHVCANSRGVVRIDVCYPEYWLNCVGCKEGNDIGREAKCLSCICWNPCQIVSCSRARCMFCQPLLPNFSAALYVQEFCALVAFAASRAFHRRTPRC